MHWRFWMSNREAKAREAAALQDELAREDYQRALREWRAAQCVFDEAVGDTQVDWAIYQLQAAERRFALCWSRLRHSDRDYSEWRGGLGHGMDRSDNASAVLSSDL